MSKIDTFLLLIFAGQSAKGSSVSGREATSSFLRSTVANRQVSTYYDGIPSQQMRDEMRARAAVEFKDFASTFRSYFTEGGNSVLVDCPDDDYEPTLREIESSDYFCAGWHYHGCTFIHDGGNSKFFLMGLYPSKFFSQECKGEAALKMLSVMSDPAYENFVAQEGHELLAYNFPKRGAEIHQLLHFMPEAFKQHSNFIKFNLPDKTQLELCINRASQRGRFMYQEPQKKYKSILYYGRRLQGFGALVSKETGPTVEGYFFPKYLLMEETPTPVDDFLVKYASVMRSNSEKLADFIVEKNLFGGKMMEELRMIIDGEDSSSNQQFLKACLEKMLKVHSENFRVAEYIFNNNLFGTELLDDILPLIENEWSVDEFLTASLMRLSIEELDRIINVHSGKDTYERSTLHAIWPLIEQYWSTEAFLTACLKRLALISSEEERVEGLKNLMQKEELGLDFLVQLVCESGLFGTGFEFSVQEALEEINNATAATVGAEEDNEIFFIGACGQYLGKKENRLMGIQL